jgi:putative ABC transport system permease protein
MDDEGGRSGLELTLVGSAGADTTAIGAVIDSPAFGVPFVVSQDVPRPALPARTSSA